MPFKSSAQMRAAFGGYLGPEMKSKATSWAKETPNIKKLPDHINQMSKKTILKKYTGRGGVGIMDVAKEIPGTLKTMGQNISKGLDPAGLVSKGIRGIGSALMKPVDSWIGKEQNMDAIKEAGFNKMKTQNWGSPENYDKLQKMPLLKKKLGK